jgi:predicted nucleic acid-binding protein
MTRHAVGAGPLVALLDGRDARHKWAAETVTAMTPPLLTCEPVLSEACFLVRHLRNGPDSVMALVARGIVAIDFSLGPETTSIRRLMAKYADVPMSLADACLVRMTELDARLKVVTFDEDFLVYRRHGRQTISVVMP